MKQKKHKNITGIIQQAFLQKMGQFNCLKELKFHLSLPDISYHYPDIICSMIKMIRKNHKYSEEFKMWEDLQGVIKFYKLDKMRTYQERFNALDRETFIHWTRYDTEKTDDGIKAVEITETL